MGYYKLVYDEQAFAEKMLKGELDEYMITNKFSVGVLAKYLKKQHIKELGITYAELNKSRRKRKAVNDEIWREIFTFYRELGYEWETGVLDEAISYSNRYKLKTAEKPVFITKSEKKSLNPWIMKLTAR